MTGRTVADIRADVATGHLSRLFAIEEVRDRLHVGVLEASAILDGARPRPRLRTAPRPRREGPPAPAE